MRGLLTDESAQSFETLTVKIETEYKKKLDKLIPEKGFKTYFPNFAVKLLLDMLEQEGVATLEERVNHDKFQNIPNILKQYKNERTN